MVHRTEVPNAFEFVILAGARARQLLRGCTPRTTGSEKLVRLAHRGFCYKAWAHVATGGPGRNESIFADYPLFHVAGVLPACVVSTTGFESDRFASAAVSPGRSRPAMGWAGA